MNPFYRNIPILSFAQAMMMSNSSLMITASALVGAGLAEDKSLATLIGASGAAIATWSILHQAFWGFVAASAIMGMHNGFGNYYRFAAADAAPPHHKGRAISFILAGGVVAAFIGPNLANISRDWISGTPFAASFMVVMGLYLCSGTALSLL